MTAGIREADSCGAVYVMKTPQKRLYAFNLTRQSFLSLGIRPADTPWSRLLGLAGRLNLRSEDGIWVVPSQGIHTFGLLFPIDVIYLDAQMRVIDVVEHLGPFRFAPFRLRCASVLELPTHSIFGSGTQVGDQLLVCSPEELYAHWRAQEKVDQATGATELKRAIYKR